MMRRNYLRIKPFSPYSELTNPLDQQLSNYIFYIETAFYNGLLKERYKGG
jgi:hypothetical protein